MSCSTCGQSQNTTNNNNNENYSNSISTSNNDTGEYNVFSNQNNSLNSLQSSNMMNNMMNSNVFYANQVNSGSGKKACSQIGLVYQDTISTHPIFTGKCTKHLGKCKPPIKATTTPNGTRGIPLTGNYNNPGFSLTRAFRMSHGIRFNKAKTTFDTTKLNYANKRYGHPGGSGVRNATNKMI